MILLVQLIRGSYIVKLSYCVMSGMIAWKCYRCNLVFKDQSHVIMHDEVSRHDAIEVKLATV